MGLGNIIYQTLWLAQAALNFAAVIRTDLLPHIRELTVYVKFGAATTAGQVVVEGAHDAAYGGTWSNIGTVNWAAADRVHHVSVPGVHRAVRVRIATLVANGTCDVYAVAD